MKENDLSVNIQQARQHIKRLKKQAELIDSSLKNPSSNFNTSKAYQESLNLNQYVNNAMYSLAKNQAEIQTKVQDYKSNKLPSIHNQPKNSQTKQDSFYLSRGYKKRQSYHTKQPSSKKTITIQNKSHKVNSFSTRADQSSMMLALQNRKAKIHSHHEKHKPGQINSDTNIPIGSNVLNLESFIAAVANDCNDGKAVQSSLKQSSYALYKQKQNSAHLSLKMRKVDQYHSQQQRQRQRQNSKNTSLNDSAALKNFYQNKYQSTSQRLGKQQQQQQHTVDKDMQYEAVVDNFSNHTFMIISGTTAVESPEFLSFQRIYKSILPRLEKEICRLQQIVSHYGIAFARFDGKKLAYLCLKQNITKMELIKCLVEGKDQILQKMPQTKYKGAQGKVRAANKIISFWKMKSVSTKYQLLKENTIRLQRFFRKKQLMLQYQRKLIKRNQQMIASFQQRQSNFQKSYKKIKTARRIQIHLNSIQIDEQKRLTIQNFTERQNIQLPRIFQLKDQNLVLIYVSSKQISLQVINYYHKMLELSGIPNIRDRLYFINPKDTKFPYHFSTSKLLYYCSRTLIQLKHITSDLPTILFAGHPCNQLIKICDFLNCYLFSGQPNKMRQFMTKSQTKRLLKNLCIETLPGSMEMYDYGQFLNTFSVLILKNTEITTWVLKIDDQFGGRGIAYFDLSKSKALMSLIKKGTFHLFDILVSLNQNDNQFFATDVASEPIDQQLTIKIRDYLKEKLSQRLVIVTPSLYRNYQEFMGRFIKKGGIIEAHPPCQRQYLSHPSASFCLEPDGQFKLVTTYEKISSQPFKNVACSFPQKTLQLDQIMSLIRQLVESFKIRKLFGYFTIDLVSYQNQGQHKFWVLDIQPFLNDYSCSYYLFDGLVQGSFIHDQNVYLAECTSQQSKIKTTSSLFQSSQRQINQQQSLESRQYIFIPHFLNKDFSKTNIKQFFKQARIQNFNFDIAGKHGVCMLLFDELTSGQMGLIAVSHDKDSCVERLKRVLDFIGKITKMTKVQAYGRSQLQPSSDALLLSEIMSKFLTLERRQKRVNSKKIAYEQFKNNRDLQLI